MGRYTKKITLIFCFLFFLFVGAVTPTLAKGQTSDIEKLPQLIHVLKDQGATIDHWSIYTRKQQQNLVSLTEVKQEASALKKKYSQSDWSVQKEKTDIRFVGVHQNKTQHTKDQIILLAYPRKNAYQTYLIYVVIGSKWDEAIWSKQLSLNIDKKINGLFGNEREIFACVSGEFNDKIGVVLSKKSSEILHELKATKVEADDEKTFMSVSAYTKVWKDSIQSGGKPINVQLGLRKLKNETTVTLGTPIITSEY